MWAGSLGQRESSLEKEMATHCSVLAWEIPWTEEPGGVQSRGLQSQTQLSTHTHTHARTHTHTHQVGPAVSTSALPASDFVVIAQTQPPETSRASWHRRYF